MNLPLKFYKKFLFLSVALVVGYLHSTLCASNVKLEAAEVGEFQDYVRTKDFLHQFARIQQIAPEVLDSGFRVSVKDGFKIVENGYPQYAVSCEISLIQQQSYGSNLREPTRLDGKNTATVFITENYVLESKIETTSKNRNSKTRIPIDFVKPIGKGNKSKNNKSDGEDAPSNTGNDTNTPTGQSSSSSNADIKRNKGEIKKLQKRIFAITNMVWDPVFKTGLALASAITDIYIFDEKADLAVEDDKIRDFHAWVRSGMASSESCPKIILALAEAAVRDRTQFSNSNGGIFELVTPINYFVCSTATKRNSNLHIVTLEVKYCTEVYYIGVILLCSKTKISDAFKVHGKIYLTNYCKQLEVEPNLKKDADEFQLPLWNWSLKPDSLMVSHEDPIGILSQLTNISERSCMIYLVYLNQKKSLPFSFEGVAVLKDERTGKEIQQFVKALPNLNDFAKAMDIPQDFPNWVRKTEPHREIYSGLEAELESIKNEYAKALSEFRGKNCNDIKFEWVLLTETTIDNIRTVVHALHIWHQMQYLETKYSLTEVSDTGSKVIVLQSDPSIWYQRNLVAWQLLQKVPFKLKVVWWTHYPDNCEPKNLMELSEVKTNLNFEKVVDQVSKAKLNVRECFGFHKHKDNKTRDIFIIYCSIPATMNTNDIHYKFLQLRFEVPNFKLIFANVTGNEGDYKTLDLAKSAIENLQLECSWNGKLE